MKNKINQDRLWMQRALALAERGRADVSPNPMVGAVLVKNGKLVAEGFHAYFGGPHAEIVALKRAGKRAKGSTLYVTLEPCASWGKTPPCVDAVIQAGIKQVVIGAVDINPANKQKGIHALKKAGIKVHFGILAKEAQEQNAAFFKYFKTRMPYVTLKMAQSLDGKIADSSGNSRWITSKPAREFVHHLRFEQDAILVGKNTLLQDNPNLTTHLKREKHQHEKPWRIVLDPWLESRDRDNVFKGKPLTVFVISEKTVKKTGKSKRHRILLPIGEKHGRLDLRELMVRLAGLGIAKILVEGGGETAWSFIESGLVDKIIWLVAPKIVGGRNAKTSVEGAGVLDINQAFGVRDLTVKKLGCDWLFEGKL